VSDELDIAVAVGKELEPLVRDFAGTVTGSPAREVGEWLADKIRIRRYISTLKAVDGARRATIDAGLPASAVPLKTLVPLLEYASLEDDDDEDMVTRWANLLANAATASAAEVPPAFPEILRQLEPLDAAMLDALHDATVPWARANPAEEWAAAWATSHFDSNLGLSPETVGMERLDNLVRLGLCYFPQGGMTFGGRPTGVRQRVLLTDLGVAFVTACRPPQPPSG
jgi:hypothetical protein